MSDYRKKCVKRKGESCQICGEKDEIEIHHVDGNRNNNQLENLIPVCRYCHTGIHEARENYEHWHSQLLPWHASSSEEDNEKESATNERVSAHELIDDLIFLENMNSSTARRLAEMETGKVPFQCPECGAQHALGGEYSLNNGKSCENCNWSGPVYKGAIEAANQRPSTNASN